MAIFFSNENTSFSLYLIACKIGLPCTNYIMIQKQDCGHLKMSKILLAPPSKPFNSRTSINPLVNLNFYVVVIVVIVVDITCIYNFLSVFLSSFIKIFENLWKWFEFIYYSFLVNNTCVSTMPLYAHVIVIKNRCWLHICIQFICVGQLGYKRLRCAIIEFISATFLRINTSQY